MGKGIAKQEEVKLEQTVLSTKKTKKIAKSRGNLKLEESVAARPIAPPTVKKVKKHRIIIRNLVFDISEKHLTKLMSPYGVIKEINIPRNTDKNTSKGFAFIQFTKQMECLKAIKEVNGKLFKGRTVVVDMAVSKQIFMSQQIEQGGAEELPFTQKIEVQEEPIAEEKVVPKVAYVPRQDEDLSGSIFVRNVPITTTEDEVYKFFRRYGKLSYAKVVKDKETGASKGTAFIKFQNAEEAQKLAQYSRCYELFMQKKYKHFEMDPTISLEMDGTIVKIFPVESRSSLQQKIKGREDEQGNKNQTAPTKKPLKKIKRLEDLIKYDSSSKRKLYLAEYGLWRATQGMPETDYARFKEHEKEKINKLKNPNNSVSDTRIILKYLSKTLTEDQIKNICLEYLREKQMRNFQLTYCKLMLNEDRKQSAGFAFVEFKKPELALGFVNWIASSPTKIQRQPFVCEFAFQDSRKISKLQRPIKKGTR